jgi:hypothetical protein
MEEKLDIKAILEKENMKVEDFRFFLPGIIELLLSKGLIDLTKASDRLYLLSVVRQNLSLSLEDLKDTGAGVRLDVEFLDNAIHAIKNDNRAVAIVLISTAIEHILNVYLYALLTYKRVSANGATNAIRRTNVEDKMSWLVTILGGELSENVKKCILKIIELRNSIVHYKLIQWKADLDLFESKRVGSIVELNFNDAFGCMDELKNNLESFAEKFNPNYALAKKLYKALVGEEYTLMGGL